MNFLIAVAISFVMVVVYSMIALLVGSIMGSPMSMEPRMAMMLSLPSTLYSAIAPDSIQLALASSPTGGMIEKIAFFAANVFIYSLPIFGIVKLLRRPKTGA